MALLQHGVDPNVRDVVGDTSLMIAAERDEIGIAKQLLLSGASANCKNDNVGEIAAIHCAAIGGSIGVLRLLLDYGVPIDPKITDGLIPMHSAIQQGCREFARVLLEAQPSLVSGENSGEKLLHYAAYYSRMEIVKLLLEFSAPVNGSTSNPRKLRSTALPIVSTFL